jgi:hypothetical protein
MSGHLPQGRVIAVQFEVELPVAATREQALEWLAFQLGWLAAMQGDNPLVFREVDALGEPVLHDTGRGPDVLRARCGE